VKQPGTDLQSFRAVHGKHPDGSPADRCEANHLCADQGEVLRPGLLARMKEWYEHLRVRINPAQIGSLRAIAPGACEGAIVGFIAATVLPGDDVFNVKRDERDTFFGKSAILAPVHCLLADQIPEGLGRQLSAFRSSRALDCRTVSTLSADR